MKRTTFIRLSTVFVLSMIPGFLPAQQSAVLENTALLGIDSAELSNDAQLLSGDMIVNNASGGEELIIRNKADVAGGSALRADTVVVSNKSSVGGDVYTNDLVLNGNASIGGNLFTPLNTPVLALPDFESGTPSANDVSVSNNGNQVLAAGDYGVLSLGNNAQLTLIGGTYSFQSVDLNKNAEIFIQGPSSIRVAGQFGAGNDATIGPGAGVGADEIIFYVAGVDTSIEAMKTGKGADLDANFYVPNGTAFIGLDSSLHGGLIARHIDIANRTAVSLAAAFRTNALPDVMDADVTTDEDQPVTIELSGSDADGDDLTFTIASGPSLGQAGAIIQTSPTTAEFLYTPNLNANGQDVLEFQADDGNGGVSTGVITIDILPVNDSPDVNDFTFTAIGNTALEVGVDPPVAAIATRVAGSLLDGASDVDSPLGSLSVVDVVGLSGGAMVDFSADGSFTYVSPAGLTGSDGFQYVVDDGSGGQSTGSVTINLANQIWFVDTANAGGAGTSADPADNFATINGNSAPGATIYFLSGAGASAGNAILQDDQAIIGRPADLTVIVDGSPVTLLDGSGNIADTPTLSGVGLASNNRLISLNVQDQGVSGAELIDLTLSNVSITDTVSDGLSLVEANGDISLGNLTVNGAGGHSVAISNASGMTEVTMQSCELVDGADAGVLVEAFSAAIMELMVDACDIQGHSSGGVDVAAHNDSVMTAQVTNNQASGNVVFAQLIAGDAASLALEVSDNNLADHELFGILVNHLGTSQAGSLISGNIERNLIANHDNVQGYGIRIPSNGFGRTMIALRNNDIDQGGVNSAVSVIARSGSSVFDIVLENNIIEHIDPTGLHGYEFVSGLTSTDGSELCVRKIGNSGTAAGGEGALLLQGFDGIFHIESFAGNGGDATSVENFISTQNTLSSVNVEDSFSFANVNYTSRVCSAP